MEGIDTYFTEHIEKAWEHSDYIDVCDDMEHILKYIDISQKKNIDYRVLACMSEKKFPQMDLSSEENMIFLGYDYAYSGGSYYSAVLNDVVSKRISTFASIHLNAYGLFETYEEILEFANSRNMMGKEEAFQKEYLEEGDFVIYKLYEMK